MIEHQSPGAVQFTSTPRASDVIWNAAEMVRSSILATAIGTFATTTGLLGLIVLRNPLVLPVVIVGIAFLTGLFVVPFVWWAIYRRPDLVLAPFEVSADEGGVSMVTPTTRARHEWSVFRSIRETGRAFVLDTGAGVSFSVAKRDVSDADIAGLRALVRRKGVLRPTSGLASRRTLLGIAIGLVAAAASILAPILLSSPR
jgi:hypothetical protein